jgi:prepilin-type processing-associated H-X9-DG protein
MGSPLRPQACSHRAVCLILIVLMAMSPAPLVAQQAPAPAPLDTSFALKDSCVMIALRPAQILSSQAASLYPVEVLQAAALRNTGLDPLLVDQLVVCMTPPMAGPPSFSVAAQFKAPFELPPSEMTKHTQPGTLEGKAYLRSPEPLRPSFFQPDDRTLVASPDALLRQLAANDQAPPADSLPGRFAQAWQGDDLLVMVDLEPLRPMVQAILSQERIPAEMAKLTNIPNLLKTIELRLNVTRPGATELIATANNEADAEQITNLFDDIKQVLMAQALAEARRVLASDDPIEQATGRYMQRMAKLADERVQLDREGHRFVLVRADVHSSSGNQFLSMYMSGVLVALLLPAIQAARAAARRNSSLNNMKQLMLGLMNYESVQKHFPAHANYSEDGKPLLSWRVHILPYMEHQALYEQFHLDEPWDSPHNLTLIPLMPGIFLDPASQLSSADGRTHYLGVGGASRLFDGTEQGRKLTQITDGTSATMALVQVDDERAVEWTKPEDWESGAANPLAGLGGLHPGGMFGVAFCDGSVRYFGVGIDPATLKAMETVDGGEEVRLNIENVPVGF